MKKRLQRGLVIALSSIMVFGLFPGIIFAADIEENQKIEIDDSILELDGMVGNTESQEIDNSIDTDTEKESNVDSEGIIEEGLSERLLSATISRAEFDSKLNQLHSQYPDYSTWNGTFDGGKQCFGFARLVAYNVLGSKPSSWGKNYNINNVKSGDLIQYGNTSGQGHTIFVTNVSGNTITFVDCNGNGNYSGGKKVRSNGVKWNNTIQKGAKIWGKYSFSYLLVSPVTVSNESGNCNCSDSYAGNYTCTSKTTLNIRSGHGSGYSVIGSIPSGATVYVSKADGNWAHVSYNGVNGYASMSYLQKQNQVPAPSGYNISSPTNVYNSEIIQVTITPVGGEQISNYTLYMKKSDGSVAEYDLGGTNQKWIETKDLVGTVEFWARVSNEGGSCTGGSGNRSVTLQVRKAEFGTVQNLGDDFYAVIKSKCGSFVDYTVSKSTNVEGWRKNNQANQTWRFIRQEDGSYKILSKEDESKALDVNGASNYSGTNVQVYEDNGSAAQRWFVYSTGDGYYYLRPKCSDSAVLDLYNKDSTDGTNIEIYTANQTDAQKWEILPFAPSGYNISLPTSVYNSEIIQVTITPLERECITNYTLFMKKSDGSVSEYDLGGANQKWIETKNLVGTVVFWAKVSNATGTYEGGIGKCSAELQVKTADLGNIQNLGSDFYTTIKSKSGAFADYEASKDENVEGWKANDGANQIWHFIRQEDGSYKILSKEDESKALDANGASNYSGTNVQVYADNGSDAQRWFVYSSADGYYYLRPKCSDSAVLDLNGNKEEDGTNIQIYTFNRSDAQKWKIEKGIVVNDISDLKIGGRAGDALRLNWNKDSKASGYIIEQNKNGKWTRIARIGNNKTTTYRVEKLVPSTTYQFRIQAFAFDRSTPVYGNYTYITGKTNPAIISGAKIGGRAADALRLNWNRDSKASGYIIEQYKNSKWTRIARIGSNTTTTYRVEKLSPSTTYKFRVQSFEFDGNTALYGNYAYVSGKTNLAIISGLKIGGTAKDALRLNWNKDSKASGYIIEQYKDGRWIRIARIGSNATTTYRVEKLQSKMTYKFRVQAFGFDGTTPVYGSYSYVSGTTY